LVGSGKQGPQVERTVCNREMLSNILERYGRRNFEVFRRQTGFA
jgi:hypothetical protein